MSPPFSLHMYLAVFIFLGTRFFWSTSESLAAPCTTVFASSLNEKYRSDEWHNSLYLDQQTCSCIIWPCSDYLWRTYNVYCIMYIMYRWYVCVHNCTVHIYIIIKIWYFKVYSINCLKSNRLHKPASKQALKWQCHENFFHFCHKSNPPGLLINWLKWFCWRTPSSVSQFGIFEKKKYYKNPTYGP